MWKLLLLVLVATACNAPSTKTPCAVTVVDRGYVRTLKNFDHYWSEQVHQAAMRGDSVRPLLAQRDAELHAIWQEHAAQHANAVLADSVDRCR